MCPKLVDRDSGVSPCNIAASHISCSGNREVEKAQCVSGS